MRSYRFVSVFVGLALAGCSDIGPPPVMSEPEVDAGVLDDSDGSSGGMADVAPGDTDRQDTEGDTPQTDTGEDSAECDLAEDEHCGDCQPLAAAIGTSCGACDSGAWTCGDDGALYCAGDGGDQLLNGCGGCEALPEVLGTACGTCGSGAWACADKDGVACVGDLGEDAYNVCGGCQPMRSGPGDACGTCGDGRFACGGPDELVCNGASEPEVTNACGGCTELLREPGESCGPCFNDEFVCDSSESVRCRTAADLDVRQGVVLRGDLFAEVNTDRLRLSAEGGPYVITEDVIVAEGKTLEVDAGTLFKFSPRGDGEESLSFRVEGALLAAGTPSNPIVFTSLRDDCNGGDTNQDGVASRAQPGDWGALHIQGAGSSLEHIELYFGGAPVSGVSTPSALSISGVRAPDSVAGIRAWFSAGVGVDVDVTGGFPTSLSELDLAQCGAGLRARVGAGGLDLASVTASDNDGNGIDVVAAGPVLATHLRAEDNRGHGISILGDARVDLGDSHVARHAGFTGLTLRGTDDSRIRRTYVAADPDVPLAERDVTLAVSPNLVAEALENIEIQHRERGVHILAGTILSATQWPAEPVYTIRGVVTVEASGTLEVGPGTTLKFAVGRGLAHVTDAGLVVHGTLRASGTEDLPITLSSRYDDDAGGDTDGDGLATEPAPGDWAGLRAFETADITLGHAHIRYAGGGDDGVTGPDAPGVAALHLRTNMAPSVRDVVVSASQSGGVSIWTDSGLPWTTGGIVVQGSVGAGSRPGVELECGPGSCGAQHVHIRDHGADGMVVEAEGSVDLLDLDVASSVGDGLTIHAGARLTLQDSHLHDNFGFGLQVLDAAATSSISSTTVQRNTHLARVHPRLVSVVRESNTLSGDAIWVTAGSVDHDTTWSGQAPLLIMEGVVEVGPEGRLGIHQGSTLKWVPAVEGGRASGFRVRGHLNVAGSTNASVYLTSYLHDHLGDSNRDGNATGPVAGDWAGILVEEEGSLEIAYTHMHFPGASFEEPDEPGAAAVEIRGAVRSFNYVTINRSLAGGLLHAPQTPGDVTFRNLTVQNGASGHYGVNLDGGADRVDLANIVVTNSGHGVRADRPGYTNFAQSTIQHVHTCLTVAGAGAGDIHSLHINFAEYGLVFQNCPRWRVNSLTSSGIRNRAPDPCE